jgi:hypothetical protein
LTNAVLGWLDADLGDPESRMTFVSPGCWEAALEAVFFSQFWDVAQAAIVHKYI